MRSWKAETLAAAGLLLACSPGWSLPLILEVTRADSDQMVLCAEMAAGEEFVLSFQESRELLARLEDLLRFLLPLYQREGKAYLTVAIGCTGGRHRSVTLVELLRTFLEGLGVSPIVRHRDLDRD